MALRHGFTGKPAPGALCGQRGSRNSPLAPGGIAFLASSVKAVPVSYSDYTDDALSHELRAKRDWLRTTADAPSWRQRESKRQIRAIEQEMQERGLDAVQAAPALSQEQADRYYEACLSWQRGEAHGELGPGGFAHGLDRADADEIAQRAYDDFKASGGTPRPLWKPFDEYQEERLIEAYRSRGLRA